MRQINSDSKIKQNIQQLVEARAAKTRRLTTKEAAAFLGFHKGTLENWRGQGIGPAYIKIHGKVFYLESVLVEYGDIIAR